MQIGQGDPVKLVTNFVGFAGRVSLVSVADLVLLVGILGNLTDEDVEVTATIELLVALAPTP